MKKKQKQFGTNIKLKFMLKVKLKQHLAQLRNYKKYKMNKKNKMSLIKPRMSL